MVGMYDPGASVEALRPAHPFAGFAGTALVGDLLAYEVPGQMPQAVCQLH